MSVAADPAGAGLDRYLVPGLVRGLDILQLFGTERSQMTLGDFACALGVTRSAMFRVIYTLTELGFLRHDARHGLYELGPAARRLGQGLPSTGRLVELAIPHLKSLGRECGGSTHLGVLEGTQVRCLAHVPCRRGDAVPVRTGMRSPAYSTPMGRVLLAGLSEQAVLAKYRDPQRASSGPLAAYELASMLTQHQSDRGQKVVAQAMRSEDILAGIAAPIRNAAGETIAAISAVLTSTRFGKMRDLGKARDLVAKTAVLLSRELGYAEGRQLPAPASTRRTAGDGSPSYPSALPQVLQKGFP